MFMVITIHIMQRTALAIDIPDQSELAVDVHTSPDGSVTLTATLRPKHLPPNPLLLASRQVVETSGASVEPKTLATVHPLLRVVK